jgi:hypothetical protein
MNPSAVRVTIVGAVVLYLAALSWSMASVDYDVWGALVAIPILSLAGVLLCRRMFGRDHPELLPVLFVGIAMKFGGAGFRFWIAFDAYGGSIDAERYHRYGKLVAGDVWSGRRGLSELMPSGSGTEFLERLTSLVYFFSGSSRLAGFMVFAFLGFVGLACFVRAAAIAVPGLLAKRYAWLCVLTPSLVYWPSSIGKDAWMLFTLGVATLGFARLLTGYRVFLSLLLSIVGLGGAAFVRPHIAGMWIAGLLPALFVATLRGRSRMGAHGAKGLAGRGVLILVTLIATAGAIAIGSAALSYLSFDEAAEGTSITSILDETTRRTKQAGSNFTPPSLASPLNWPYAAVRTLTRPLLFEARSAFQLLSALEMTAFVVICAVSWRRVVRLPRMFVQTPYIAFAITVVFVAGLAYSSFANLGVLTRQKSLVLPLMLLIPCLPTDLPSKRPKGSAQNSSMSPRDNFQFDNGGTPVALTDRQVRMGPP